MNTNPSKKSYHSNPKVKDPRRKSKTGSSGKIKALLMFNVFLIIAFFVAYYLANNLPNSYEITKKVHLNSSPSEVWAILTTPEDFANWREGVRDVKMIDSNYDTMHWVEFFDNGDTLESISTKAIVPVEKEIRSISNHSGYSAMWSWSLEPTYPTGTDMAIVEKAKLNSMFLKALNHYVLDNNYKMNNLINDLKRKIAKNNSARTTAK